MDANALLEVLFGVAAWGALAVFCLVLLLHFREQAGPEAVQPEPVVSCDLKRAPLSEIASIF